MAQLIITNTSDDPITHLRENKKQDLAEWIGRNLDDYIAGRHRMEQIWRDAFRLYEAIPKQQIRNTPIENAPNIEVPVSMVGVDVFYAISLQTIFNVSDLVYVKAQRDRPELIEPIKAFTEWVQWGVRNEFNPRAAANHMFLDNIQLGTGVYYIPWVLSYKKTKVHQILDSRPEIQPWPVEDVIVPPGTFQSVDNMPLISLRSYFTEPELTMYSRMFDWDTSKATPTASIGWVKSMREDMGRSLNNQHQGRVYEIHDVYCLYDLDEDGYMEDLLVTYDRGSRSILKVRFNPYDRRPIEYSNYQTRAYMFYGMGIPEKLKSIQEEISDIHNARNLNMLLANTRFWAVSTNSGISDQFSVWPNKVMKLNDPHNDINAIQMGDIYNSFPQAELMTTTLANRLVGLDEMQSPKPSTVFSSRTPATTAQAGLIQQNQRFGAAFDGMKSATAGAIKQCVYRYQEKIKAGDGLVLNNIKQRMGQDRAKMIIDLLQNPQFDEEVDIMITATSGRQSREARLQSQLQLNQIMMAYYQKVVDLVTIASNPQVPTAIQDVANKVGNAAAELMEKTMRDFDTLEDPSNFVIRFQEEMDRAVQVNDQSALLSATALQRGMEQAREDQGEADLLTQLGALSGSGNGGNGQQS